MQFNDIFKASFLERSATFSVVDTVISLALACVIGLFIYFIYQRHNFTMSFLYLPTTYKKYLYR